MIEEEFLMKTFSHAGKIKKTIIGSYKPKVSRRAHKRTIYFALVVFKEAASADKVVNDSKFLQNKINSLAKRDVGYQANPFLMAGGTFGTGEIMEEDVDAPIPEALILAGKPTLHTDTFEPDPVSD